MYFVKHTIPSNSRLAGKEGGKEGQVCVVWKVLETQTLEWTERREDNPQAVRAILMEDYFQTYFFFSSLQLIS